MDQTWTPLYDALIEKKEEHPISFHVPGHKYGKVFSSKGLGAFRSLLQLDATEIPGLDDLHAPEGIIKQAQQLTSDLFRSDESFFLVNGTTSGNLAMILTVCNSGDTIIVQRNCHKSVLNGLELAGAQPVFLSPEYEQETDRYSKVDSALVEQALHEFPQAKAVFLTYPDYFGRTFDIEDIITKAHACGVPVLVDEAHGVHFQLGCPFPSSALDLGADLVVQSAHKMAPAMTMASYLHVNSKRIAVHLLRHYLQMLQSSSPSYPLMASLDLARHFLANYSVRGVMPYAKRVRQVFETLAPELFLLPLTDKDDPLKITLQTADGVSAFEAARVFEEAGVYPELTTPTQLLFILGLTPGFEWEDLEKRIAGVNCQLKKITRHATIKTVPLEISKLEMLAMSYSEMAGRSSQFVEWKDACGHVAAEAVIPYPPGIPFIMKGESIRTDHLTRMKFLIKEGTRFQNNNIELGIRVFKGEWS